MKHELNTGNPYSEEQWNDSPSIQEFFLKMNRKTLDFIDFEKVNMLLEGFNKTTGFVTAILDLEMKRERKMRRHCGTARKI